jgi:hypothetical protein
MINGGYNDTTTFVEDWGFGEVDAVKTTFATGPVRVSRWN